MSFSKTFKQIFSRKSSADFDKRFNEENRKLISQWAKEVRALRKKTDPNVQNDELYEDSLLIIEWNSAGLVHRNNLHGINAINALVALIRDQPGCVPFPKGTPSDSAFSFVRTPNGGAHQNLHSCISQLTTSTMQWWRHSQGNPDVGRAYMSKDCCVNNPGIFGSNQMGILSRFGDERLNEERVRTLRKNTNPNVQSNELYEDPLLIIEWNPDGLVHRNNLHGINAINTISALIRGQPGCVPFPPNGTPSDSIFSFVKTPNGEAHQNLQSCISQLTTNTAQWWRHTQGNPDVGRAYMVSRARQFVAIRFIKQDSTNNIRPNEFARKSSGSYPFGPENEIVALATGTNKRRLIWWLRLTVNW
ncbi:15530_t:CDS:2 [Funneliformis mosseae]|uniref:15530_t:CDS:1 n=1 Tax=Funneliformis mosseae TaxID=27381 RepID=A0A9N8UXE8_FUNMO|nr:15530_t:CDS:2 [Funneliformis mosseae]